MRPKYLLRNRTQHQVTVIPIIRNFCQNSRISLAKRISTKIHLSKNSFPLGFLTTNGVLSSSWKRKSFFGLGFFPFELCVTLSRYRPALRRPNLDVLLKAQVTRILFDKYKRANGVEFKRGLIKRRHVARVSKEVVLSAGAIVSPQVWDSHETSFNILS